MAAFKILNLLDDFSSLGIFDIVFCRFVAINFSEQEKDMFFEQLARSFESAGRLSGDQGNQIDHRHLPAICTPAAHAFSVLPDQAIKGLTEGELYHEE